MYKVNCVVRRCDEESFHISVELPARPLCKYSAPLQIFYAPHAPANAEPVWRNLIAYPSCIDPHNGLMMTG